ncbi:zinc finger protein 711-like [Amblyomma americanum]
MECGAAVCLLSASFQLPAELGRQEGTAQVPSGTRRHASEPRKRLWAIWPAGPNAVHFCCDCELQFRRLSKLIAHVVYKHDFDEDERTNSMPCPICTRRCRSQSTMAAHLGTHLGERVCKKCRAQFASAGAAAAHKYFHRHAGNFKCEWCVKRFARMSDLKQHSRMQHGRLARGVPNVPKPPPCLSSE